ncbi:MAG TPA: methionyl-tRNA formyltransferase [Sulfuricaulis sp.]|jgi:methionyl-tRNA formyltransferase|nr:methionyl-tRNA formyltransferase [Sulfuricaulis sp.]
MRIAIIGQQDFGKEVLEAFLRRGDEAAAVFCAPEKAGFKPDALRVAAQEQDLKLFQFESLRLPEATQAMQDANAEIGIMAFVLQFAPQEFVNIPKYGTIQYHPSLLPKYRGPSSINWPIIKGETETGLTIFRPTDGLDEGAVILQKKIPIGVDDTLGTVYFDRLFKMGVDAMLEAADLVVAGKHKEVAQDESKASYEGWCRHAEARIHWHHHVDFIHNLIRGCDPAPGAWTTCNGVILHLFGSRKHLVRTFRAVKGKIGEVVAVSATSMLITAHGGRIEVTKGKLGNGKKVMPGDLGIEVGTILGT